MKQILFKLFENLKQLGIKPNIGSRTNVTPIRGSEIDRLINRPVTPKEFDYSKPEVVDSMRSIVQNASDYVGQFTERQLKTFNDNVERILGVIKPKEITADVVDIATKEKITGPGLESLMKEKGVASISRKTIEAETLIKQFLDDDLISLNAKQIDQLSRGKAEDVFENIFGSKAKELITGKNTNESLNEVYNKLKTTKDTRGRLPDDPSFDPSDINFKDGGSVSEDVKQLLKEEFIELINADPESFPDTNAGFRRFLKRKGSPVFNYKKGGEVKEPKQTDAEIEEEIRENKKELLGKKSILDLYKGNTLFGLDLDFADKNIGGEFGQYNKKDIKDPRIGLSIIPNVQDDTSSRWGISIGPRGGGLTFMKPFSQIGFSGDWEEVPESWYEDNIPDVNVLIPELPEMKKGGRVNLRQGGGLYPEELLPLIGKETELSNRELEKLFSESDMSEEDISKYYKKYPIKLGDLEINPRVNITSGDFSPNPFTTVSDKSQLSGGDIRYKIKDGIYATGSLDKQRNSRNIKYDFPFIDEAITQSNTYKRSPYTVGLDYEGDQSVITSTYDPEQKQFNIRGTYLFEPGGGLNKLFKGYGGMKKGGVANLFKKRKRYADGGASAQDQSEFLDIPDQVKSYIASLSRAEDKQDVYDLYRRKKAEDQSAQRAIEEENRRENLLGKTFPEGYFDPATYEIPTVDPFSGQQVSAQDQAAFGTTSGINFSSKYESLEYDPATNNYIKVIREGSNAGGNEARDPIVSNVGTGIFSGPAYDTYSQARSDAYTNSPNKFTYDVTANQAAGQFAQDKLKELLGDNILSQTLGTIGTVAAVPLAFYSSPFHEAAQVINEGRMEPGSGIKGFYDAFMNELPLSTAANRAAGVLKSIPGIGESIYSGAYNLGESLGNLRSNISNPNVQRTVNVGSYDPGVQALGASIGNLDYSTMNALRNNADLLNTITGQTTNMANGGLTKTIPPVRGPNPQGVESLFKKRYN